VLQNQLRKLNTGYVDEANLVERNRVSTSLGGTPSTPRTSLHWSAWDQELAVHPGQEIEYVVVDDEKNSRERVALAHETVEGYDTSYYETQLIHATESIPSPVGWEREDIRSGLAETQDCQLNAFPSSVGE